jgi:large subunit ribosomal protein LP2
MQYIAAYALCALSGTEPTKKDVQAVLKAGGVTADATKVDELFAQLEGKKFDEVAAEGKKKLGSGGGGGGAAPAAGGAAAPAAAKKEDTTEEDDDMGMGLFD